MIIVFDGKICWGLMSTFFVDSVEILGLVRKRGVTVCMMKKK